VPDLNLEIATTRGEEISAAVQPPYNIYREYQCIAADTDEGESPK
jgi:hypothetical protein